MFVSSYLFGVGLLEYKIYAQVGKYIVLLTSGWHAHSLSILCDSDMMLTVPCVLRTYSVVILMFLTFAVKKMELAVISNWSIFTADSKGKVHPRTGHVGPEGE